MSVRASPPFRVRVAAGDVLPSWASRDAIPPGTRRNVSRNLMRDVDSCPKRDCTWTRKGSLEGVFSAWSGGALATDYSEYGALVCWGGGHGDNADNSVYVFDLTTRLWQRLGTPSPYAEDDARNDRTHSEHPDGQPIAMHTYAGAQYLPARLGGGPKGSFLQLACPGPAGGRNQAHRFDLATQRWSRWGSTFDTRELQMGSAYPMTCFDSRRGGFWYAGWYGSNSSLFFHPDGRFDVFKVGSNTAAGVPAYSPALDLVAMIGWVGAEQPTPHLYVMQPARASTSAPTAWETTPWSGDMPLTGPVSLDWCPPLRAFVGYTPALPRSTRVPLAGQAHADLYVLRPPPDPMRGTWSIAREPIGGDPPVHSPAGNGGYGRFRWVERLQAFVWAEGKDNPVQLVRPRGA